MTVNWRPLLDELRVEWADRGANCSQGNVNICCPFCGDDPSFHLAISESKDAFYCYRNPKHGGTNLTRLLVRLGVDYADVPDLLNSHNSDVTIAPRPRKEPTLLAKQWARFSPASESRDCLRYLQDRGFRTPIATCRQYDLRFAREGKWARRLLLPVRLNDEVLTWTGRALDGRLSPKYLTDPIDRPMVYLPRSVRDTLIIVEGPLDALKIAAASDALPVSSLALLGKGMAPAKLELIAELAKAARHVCVALDADVLISDVYALIYELQAMINRTITRLPLPDWVKDPGDLSADDVDDWLRDELN